MSYSDQVTRTVLDLKRKNGIAGQFQITARVRYDYPDAPSAVTLATFVGSTYGGAPVMVLESGLQAHVSDAGRFGDFATAPTDWVRRFFE